MVMVMGSPYKKIQGQQLNLFQWYYSATNVKCFDVQQLYCFKKLNAHGTPTRFAVLAVSV